VTSHFLFLFPPRCADSSSLPLTFCLRFSLGSGSLDKRRTLCDPPRPNLIRARLLSYLLRQRQRRHSAEDHVFADELSRLWNAALSRHGREWAVVFACITDARQPIRVLAVSDDARGSERTEEMLRDWLAKAPRLGPLS
jgi:hypothetical protein